ILFYFQFRSISALSQSSTVVLQQLSQGAVDGVTQTIEDTLKAPYINVLLRTNQQLTDPLNLQAIAPLLEQGLHAEPFVTRFYVWSDVVTTEHRDQVLAYDRDHDGILARVPAGGLKLG